MRAPLEQPEGLVYRPDLVSPDEEAELLRVLEGTRFAPIVMHGQVAKRTARHYGLGYDYEARTPSPGEPIPAWILPVRARAANLGGYEPDDLAEVLVQCYPPGSTIGWHRDAPAFETVIGVSLGGSCRLRFQRGKGDERRVWEVGLAPRSGYVLADKARTSWQHSIPPTKELRHSITFRTLRTPGHAANRHALAAAL
ncbi:MAG: alpha-ketoglutarate-dependent dioxygenase AlkB [Gaiellaceae bacterium]